MLESIRFAFLATSIIIGCALPAFAQSLNGEQIRALFIGTPFEVRRLGMRAQLLYAPDGTFTMGSRRMAARGTWEIKGETICATVVSGQRQGEQCFTLQALDGGRLRTSEGMVLNPVQ